MVVRKSMNTSLSDSAPVDVVVPVYRGLDQTRRCLESVLAARQETPFELVLIDDCGPDPGLRTYLAALQGRSGVTLLVNDRNLGFVGSVNRGMALHPDRDVVLLNSDTEVANDWLDRLRRCACSEPEIGTVTPFSNNATICSYPYEGWSGGVPGTLGLRALDALFARANPGLSVEVPTAVGFCMYIRRACLDATGYFDAERFGRGYGEENDFCMRAARAGWRNMLAADLFVYHEGGVSFGAEGSDLQRHAIGVLLEAHPDYLARVEEWKSRDPAARLRAAVDLLRIGIGQDEARQVLTEHQQHLRAVQSRSGSCANDHLPEIDALRAGLAHAEALVAELRAGQLTYEREIGALRAGLAHAEALVAQLQEGMANADRLAVESEQELGRIKSTRLWKWIDRLAKWRS